MLGDSRPLFFAAALALLASDAALGDPSSSFSLESRFVRAAAWTSQKDWGFVASHR